MEAIHGWLRKSISVSLDGHRARLGLILVPSFFPEHKISNCSIHSSSQKANLLSMDMSKWRSRKTLLLLLAKCAVMLMPKGQVRRHPDPPKTAAGKEKVLGPRPDQKTSCRNSDFEGRAVSYRIP